MTEQLPITINIHHALIERFSKIKSVCNKLEAQFNFQTLTASWYGDEDNILSIQLFLETTSSLLDRNNALNKLNSVNTLIKQFSDDVICCINDIELQLDCFVAMTESELALIQSQPKLLAGLIQVKLKKVLNLIAEQRSLTKI